MEAQEALAAKRRVLIDALIMCLERSQVCTVVDAKTVKFVLDSASTDLWREGEFRLEPVWKILCQQPGLGPKEVAPPMLAFKSFEQSLGVRVRLPPALSSIPQNDQQRLRDSISITQEDFDRSISEMQQLAIAEQVEKTETAKLEAVAEQAATTAVDSTPVSTSGPDPAVVQKKRKRLAIILGALALVMLPIGLYITFRPPEVVDLTEWKSILLIVDGHREGDILSARIEDARWEAMKDDEQQKAATRSFDIAVQKGFKIMTLTDGERRLRVTAFLVDNERKIKVHH